MQSQDFSLRRASSLAQWSMVLLLVATVNAQQSATDTSQSNTRGSSAITGRILNESGQPLPGATVYVNGWNASGRRPTATDSDGYFKAEGLDPGIYRVFANLPAYVSESSQTPDSNDPPPYYRPGDSVTIRLIKGGVIAGIVTNAAGEPVVNVPVRANRVRDVEGKPLQPLSYASRGRLTDDRGYYRLYGLQPGSYVVSAGGQSPFVLGYAANPYANDVPIYAPASTRDAALEFAVRSGEEITADIRYRGEPGHSISGRVTGVQPNQAIPGVSVADIASRAVIATASAMDENRGFQLNGIPDGDYEIIARGGGPNADPSASAPRRVSVRGADVTGLELTLAPLASITARVSVELDPKLNCGRRRDAVLRETLIAVRRSRAEPNAKDKASETMEVLLGGPSFSEAIANDKSEVTFRNFAPGIYRFETRLPGFGWYVRGISVGNLDQKPAVRRTAGPNISRDGITLKSGDKVSGITVTISEGGASLRGRASAAEGQPLPQNIRVYLVPAEREEAENVLRFFEQRADGDGRFVIGNVAPGRYWVIARVPDEPDPAKLKPIREDPGLRAKIIREAESLKKEISFKPCERTTDYDLPFVAATSPKQ